MDLLVPIVQLVQIILDMYWHVVVAAVILSWLVNFSVINTHNQFVHMIWSTLRQMTEPVFLKIRRYVPIVGGLDLSPIVLLLGLWLAQLYLNILIVWMVN
ncbi:MAG: YggT family protein [Rhodospirillaceae bacterium]|nr:YggT family protein [Rhodospirillaceae bacterium]